MNREQIVNSYGATKHDVKYKIRHITTTQQDTSDTIIGINHNTIFSIDPRVKELVTDYSYGSSIKLTCIISYSHNDLVITGDLIGTIRLYNSIGKKALKSVVGYGDPVISLDIYDNFLLACYEKYILMIDYSETNQNKLATKFNGSKFISFQNAKFNLCDNKLFVVANTNHKIIVWDASNSEKPIEIIYEANNILDVSKKINNSLIVSSDEKLRIYETYFDQKTSD